MIILFCKCGVRYLVEEEFIGSSFLCMKCRNLQTINPARYSTRYSGNSAKPSTGLSYRAGAMVGRYKSWFPSITVFRVFLALLLIVGAAISGILVYQSQSRGTGTPKQTLPISTSLPTESKDDKLVQAKAQQPSSTRQSKKSQPPDYSDLVVDTGTRKDQPTSPTQPPKIAKGEFQTNEIEPINPNRLHTGAAPFGYGIREGRCIVSVMNGTDTDALVRVMRVDGGEREYRNFYILAGKSFRAERFPAGNYILKVAFGSDWNDAQKRFNFRRSFEKTELFTLSETTTREPTAEGYVERTRFSNMTITLHKVIDGNFHSSQISEAEFWR